MLRTSSFRQVVLASGVVLGLLACRQRAVDTAAATTTPGAETTTATATTTGTGSPGTAVETTTTTTTTRLVTVDPVEASQHNARRRRAPRGRGVAPKAASPPAPPRRSADPRPPPARTKSPRGRSSA